MTVDEAILIIERRDNVLRVSNKKEIAKENKLYKKAISYLKSLETKETKLKHHKVSKKKHKDIWKNVVMIKDGKEWKQHPNIPGVFLNPKIFK